MIVKKINVKKKSITASNKRYVKAGPDSFDNDIVDDIDDVEEDDAALSDAVDDVADTVEDLQDSIEDVKDDDVAISVNNNIGGHYIAECDQCNGIFISAVVESDQEIESVSGICPLCGKETEQYLKWIIKDVK